MSEDAERRVFRGILDRKADAYRIYEDTHSPYTLEPSRKVCG
jgi:hypothetical protein